VADIVGVADATGVTKMSSWGQSPRTLRYINSGIMAIYGRQFVIPDDVMPAEPTPRAP